MSRACRLSALGTSVVALCVALAGCGDTTSSQAVRVERSDRAVRLASETAVLELRDWPAHPEVDPAETATPALRIISTAPSITEILCALGLRDCVVGRTRYCQYPPGIESTPIVPTLNRANVETLLALEPDIVLVFGQAPTLAQKLADAGIRCEALPDKTLSAIFDAIRRVGSLTGRTRTASALCRSIEAELDAVTEAYRAANGPRVLLLTGTLESPPRPPFVAGPGSYYDALLRRSGFVNVVANQRQAYAPLSLEFIARADPDVIVELDPDGRARPHGDADALRAWRKVGALRAVRSGRVHALVGPEYYVPGPRIAGTYAELCRVISGI